jgi:hypothetical protein
VIPVVLAPEVVDSPRRMRDRGEQPKRCHDGIIGSAISDTLKRLIRDDLSGGVRRWDLPALRRRAAQLGDVSGARAVCVDADVLVASEDLGQDETESRHGYRWTDADGRSMLAEEIETEVFDGATSYSEYLRGVVIDGFGGAVLAGGGDTAVIVEG